MSEIKLDTEKHDIADLLRYLDGDHHMGVYDRSELVKDIRSQLPNPLVEPTEFGSIVRAGRGGSDCVLWTPLPSIRRHYWISETGIQDVWSELTDVEVLRVGLGNADEDKLAAALRDGHNEGLGADIDKVREEAWNDGAREMNTQIHQGVSGHLDNAIGAERKNALERVLALVEELAP